jgi:putative ABC transport system substrate-binding protein
MRRTTTLAVLIAAFTLTVCVMLGCKATHPDVMIAVNQFMDHPNLAATYQGFAETVQAWAQRKNIHVEMKVQNANGNINVATQIAREQASLRPNLILALATPSAQAAVRATSRIPIVFGAITDPVKAGLVKSLDAPGGNATGTSDRWPYESQFALIRLLLPRAKVVGFVLNPGEANTTASMELIQPALDKEGFSKIEAPVSNTNELLGAAESLVGRCDLMFAPADNTVLLGIEALVKVAERRKLPLFVGDEGSVRKGGVATYGIDYRALGRSTGDLAIRILEGTPAGSIPVAVGSSGQLFVNPDAAARQGVVLPPAILKGASIIR